MTLITVSLIAERLNEDGYENQATKTRGERWDDLALVAAVVSLSRFVGTLPGTTFPNEHVP